MLVMRALKSKVVDIDSVTVEKLLREEYTVGVIVNRMTKEVGSMPENMLTIHGIYDMLRVFRGEEVFSILAGMVNDENFIKSVRKNFGLDKPLYEQLIIYLNNVLRGDLGYSYLRSEPVTTLIFSRIPATFLLILTAMFVASFLGILLGIVAAIKRGVIDSVISLTSLLGISIPYFWLGQLMLIIFAINLNLFPTGGMISLKESYQGLSYYIDILYHLFLPATTLAIFNLAYVTKITRGSMIEEMTQDYT